MFLSLHLKTSQIQSLNMSSILLSYTSQTIFPVLKPDPTASNSQQLLRLYASLMLFSATQSNTYAFIHAQHSLMNVRYREVL
jgi:hypothetical protein